MLIPKEKPFLTGLNSYYLYLDKFIEHLQGEIGSGCFYCQSANQEILVYFDEREIIRSIIQDNGKRAQFSQSLKPVTQALSRKNFLVTIYYLNPSSIFFWGQIPCFQRAKAKIKTTDISLPDLFFRLRQKNFSGFIDVNLQGHDEGGILFLHQGERRGGSYSWGTGGFSPLDDDYNRLLGLLQTNVATYDIGQFNAESVTKSESAQQNSSTVVEKKDYFSNLETALKEFIELYLQVIRKKIKASPLVPLKQKFVDCLDDYSVLDSSNKFYELNEDGTVEFADNAPKEEIAAAIVDCTWKVVKDNKLQKKFRAAIKKWSYRTALEERGIDVER
jgi:hypothetical protein